jgi:hypothetical protein
MTASSTSQLAYRPGRVRAWLVRGAVGCLAGSLVLLVLAASAIAQPKPADPPAAASTPSGQVSPLSPDPVGTSPIPGVDAAESALGRITDVVTGGVGQGTLSMLLAPISQSLQAGLSGVIDELAEFIDTTANPDPVDAAFLAPGGPYDAVASFAAALLVGFICLSVAYGLLSGEPGQVLIRLVRDSVLASWRSSGSPG